MKNGNNSFNNPALKENIKKILAEAKKQNLIKPHTLAFSEYPSQKESHKGNKNCFIIK